MKNKQHTLDANEAAAYVAHKTNEICVIYPITPASPMGEYADLWSAENKTNIWNTVPYVVEMQSEAGAAGAVHGALQTGSITTTFTASQGLLLMLPNMFKIAGELTPTVFHIAARSLACQALSIFGDHSDVMAARTTGFAMLASSSVQEAHDMALITQAATLASRVPFMHFFDGFRTSHEINKIEMLSDDQIRNMIDDQLIIAHRERALSSEHPFIRGTSQNPDVYFQARESVNPFYDRVPEIVEKAMKKFEQLTGRSYALLNYFGDKNAERVIILMGSGIETARETVNYLTQKLSEKVAVIQIHLFRPFPEDYLLKTLPKTVKAIAVLDRTKEPGTVGEPLYEDIATTICNAPHLKNKPKIIGGRYGLSSKEFTPAMIKAIFDELKKDLPKSRFTVGINDDVTHLSLDYDETFDIEPDNVVRAIFYGLGSDGTVGANKNSIKIIGESTPLYAQGYFVYDSKKSGSRTASHLRFGPNPIRSTYLIHSANFVACHQFQFLKQIDVLKHATAGATFLLNSPFSADEVWDHLPQHVQQQILEKQLKFYVIDAYKVAQKASVGIHINTIMQTCFFAMTKILPTDQAITKIKEAILETYGKKGEAVVKKNYAAVDHALENLHEVNTPTTYSPKQLDCRRGVQTMSNRSLQIVNEDREACWQRSIQSKCAGNMSSFVHEVTTKIMADLGDQLPVSALPPDGTYPSDTTRFEKRNVSLHAPVWDENTCLQCGMCSFVCPHAVIRTTLCDKDDLKNAPKTFKHATSRTKPDKEFTLQIYAEDCTGCGLCVKSCPAKNKNDPTLKAINMAQKSETLEPERQNIQFFETLPLVNRETLNTSTVRDVQFLQPLFQFSGACAGCGETPYIRLVTQLFGDRMIVANATGCSSIYGGNLPTTPWSKNKEGFGPAWSNSLFEDNAEFGLGFRLSENKHHEQARALLEKLKNQIGEKLCNEILTAELNTDASFELQRKRVTELKKQLKNIQSFDAKNLLSLADYLIKHSIWIIGGDGWAYDIGFGGLDHVLASGLDVNVLVLDTQVYSNTGGQSSKATPRGAIAKFAAHGKKSAKKDLGMMLATYGYIYVAQIALDANPAQALKAIKEAENYKGPSILIAYSQCIAHGFNLENGIEQQKLAVKSGAWPLYRYNPELTKSGLNPMQLDSEKPTIPFKEYALNETRFKSLMAIDPEAFDQLMKEAQEDINWRFAQYEKLAK